MWRNPQETAGLITFIEEILNGKLHFLRSVIARGKEHKQDCFWFDSFNLFSTYIYVLDTLTIIGIIAQITLEFTNNYRYKTFGYRVLKLERTGKQILVCNKLKHL